MAFTKIVGAGIHTLSNVHTHNINSSGIITATNFVGVFSGTNGDFSGNVTIDGNLTVNGNTTTLDTTLQEVDQLFVSANNTNYAGIITQTGTGNILGLFDGVTRVFNVADGGATSTGALTVTGDIEVVDSTPRIKITDSDATGNAYAFIDGQAGKLKLFADLGDNVSDSEIIFGVDGSTPKMVIDSSGRILMGGTSSRSVGFSHKIQLEDTGGTPRGISIVSNRNDAHATHIDFAKSRGTSLGSNTIVQDDDYLGHVIFRGADGTDLAEGAAKISAAVDGTPASNDIPGRLEFYTATGGTLYERLRIDNGGDIFIGTTSDIAPVNGTNLCVSDATIARLILEKQSTRKFEIGAQDFINIYDHTANAERFRIDSDGQIGIGAITPDTWSTGHGLTIGTSQATLWGVGDQVNLSGNAYFNSGWKAAATKAGASQIQQALGQIDLRVTGSVNADAAITWIDALRITKTGNVGISSAIPSEKLDVTGTVKATNFVGALPISNDSNNRVITATGSGGLDAEANLTFSGSTLKVNSTTGHSYLKLNSNDSYSGSIHFGDQSDDDAAQIWYDNYQGNGMYFRTSENTPMSFYTNATPRLKITSDGKLLVGTTTTTNNIREGNKIGIVGTVAYTGMSISQYAGTHVNHAPMFDFNRSRGTSDQSMTSVAVNDKLGEIIFRGSDGSNFEDGVAIRAWVDGTPANDTTDMPGRLTFHTSADGDTSLHERLRITSAGKLVASTNTNTTTAFDYAALHFDSDNSTVAEGLFINNTNAAPGDNASISFSTDSGNRKKSAISHIDTGSYGRGDLVFSIDPQQDSGELDIVAHEKLRITSAGCIYSSNFGIGTDDRWKIRPNNTNADLAFEYSTSSTLSDSNIKMVLKPSGKVGINDDNPPHLLNVKDTSNSSFPTIGLECSWTSSGGFTGGDGSTSGGYGELRLGYVDGYNRSIRGSYNLGLSFFTNNQEALRLNNAGTVLEMFRAGSTFRGRAYGTNNFEIRGTGSNDNLEIVANANQENVSDADIVFKSSITGGALHEKLRIKNDGAFYIKSPVASTGDQPGEIQWWNENGAGVMAKIVAHREGTNYAPSGLKFYTTQNVDTSANNSQGDITERFFINSEGKFYKGGHQFYPCVQIYEARLSSSVSNSTTGSWQDIKTVATYTPKKVGNRVHVQVICQTWNGAQTDGTSDAYARLTHNNGGSVTVFTECDRVQGNFMMDERYHHNPFIMDGWFTTTTTNSTTIKFQGNQAGSLSVAFNWFHAYGGRVTIMEYDIT